ncbi:hypothetical protein Bhyg_07342 [Pseudolycoriella hygida]|uniref:THAP-type domain-containing protein n=1 Tax=Pseudolycoriella hygida TaxID=35572 RepID=A0A9Q0N2E9_9DIPT|nr:hypothetical protein Bhyg_07342 [Pseudolycoriella hygida]
MPRNCCVPQCNSEFRKENATKLHLFPKESNLKKKWIVALKLGKAPTLNQTVRSKHFLENDYVFRGEGLSKVCKRLRPGTVPTVNLPQIKLEICGIIKTKHKRKPPAPRSTVPDVSVCSVMQSFDENVQTFEMCELMDADSELSAVESVVNREVKKVMAVNVSTQTSKATTNVGTQIYNPTQNVGNQTALISTHSTQVDLTINHRVLFLSINDHEIYYMTGLDRPRFLVIFACDSIHESITRGYAPHYII